MGLAPTLALLAIFLSAPAFAQKFGPDFLGPEMPTPETVVDAMLRDAKVRPGETVYDLGCGDGRILIAAAQKYHARAVGVEISRDIYEKTEKHVHDLGLSDKVTVIHGNALHVDLSSADVVTLYLLTSSNERLKPALARLHPGARVVSHDFEIRGWKPVDVDRVTVMGHVHTVYVYEIGRQG